MWKGHNSFTDAGLFGPRHLYFILTVVCMVLGLVLIAFSKEKIEDEQITQLRMDSLQWAVYFNYLLLVVALLFTTGNDAYDLMRTTLWAPLMFFIIRFRWVMYRLNRQMKNEA